MTGPLVRHSDLDSTQPASSGDRTGPHLDDDDAAARRQRWAAIVVVSIALLVRMWRLGHAAPTGQEALRWDLVTRAVSQRRLWPSLLLSPDAPLGPALQILLARRFGVSWIVLRLPWAVAGSLSVLLLHRLLRRSVSRASAFAIALVMALNPFLVFHDRDARPTALALLLALVFCSACTSRPAESRSWRSLAAIGGAAFLMEWALPSAWALPAAFFSTRLFEDWRLGRREALKGDRAALVVSLLACAPALSLYALRDASPLRAMRVAASGAPRSLAAGLLALFYGASPNPSNASALALGAAGLALLVGPMVLAHVLGRHRRNVAPLDPALAYLWLTMPAMLALARGSAGAPLVYDPVDYVAAAPFLIAAWGLHLQALPGSRRVRAIIAAAALLPSLASTAAIVAGHPHPSLRADVADSL
jgi:hypothetical protein